MSIAKKKILFVTNVNLAANPRCLKEIRATYNQGAEITVVKFVFDNWSNNYEQEIEAELSNVNWIKLSAYRKPLMPWLQATFINQLAKQIIKFSGSAKWIAYSLDKRSYLLSKKLNMLSKSFDWVIAHNPGALWPAYQYADNNNVNLGIDIEDYHPGEYNSESYTSNMVALMKKVNDNASYLTAASPKILEYTINNTGYSGKAAVVNNVFSLKQQPSFQNLEIKEGKPIKLFWFSQHIDMDRGLQDIVGAMNLITDFPIQLTLMGNCNDAVKNTLNDLLKNKEHTIHIIPPATETQLIAESANHHIGLALETGVNLNRNLCLTNKIFTYLLAGNMIIASDTEAQTQFIASNPHIGMLYSRNDIATLASIITKYYSSQQSLQSCRRAAYELATTTYNWEKEQAIFLSMINNN
ncbi:MAG: hypothetical protein JST82_17100 [Bacteroidetes bacterium]|nr:hypothetical protein [Bacteroidota bacterium]